MICVAEWGWDLCCRVGLGKEMQIVKSAKFNVLLCISTYAVNGTAGKCVQLGEQGMTPREFEVDCGKGGLQKWADSLRVIEGGVVGMGVGKCLEQHGVVKAKASAKRQLQVAAELAQGRSAKQSRVK